MKKIAIVYGSLTNSIQMRAIKELSEFLLDFTMEYPICVEYGKFDVTDYRCIYVGTKENNLYIKNASKMDLTHDEEYYIKVEDDTAIIQGSDDKGVLYGCIDFYNKYILKFEYPHDGWTYRFNIFENETLPDFEYTSRPSVKNRGLWTWGHVIYDYRGYIDNMVKLKMNSVIIWNDFPPVNAKEMVEYAHSVGIRIFWGYSWGWSTACDKIDMNTLDKLPAEIFEQYQNQYANLGADGIYFQSFTELDSEYIGDVLIADAVTNFVNNTSELFLNEYPDMEIQWGLHANSVNKKLESIKNTNPKITIVWENCGSFPFSYVPCDVENFDETLDFVDKISVLRGEDDKFGVVTKGLVKLKWASFEHLNNSHYLGTSSAKMKANRIVRKNKIWKYIQAGWISYADKALEMVKRMAENKDGDLYVFALVEDGMFEENIMYPVALYSEMLWDKDGDIKEMMSSVATRSYVDFA